MKRRSALKAIVLAGVSFNSLSSFVNQSTFNSKKTMWNNTKFTKLLGIEYPIIQGPFGGGLSSVKLTSTVSNSGGLGSFGGQPFSSKEIIETCNEIRKLTKKPFNINLWVNDRDERLASFGDKDYKRLTDLFKPYFNELGMPIPERPTNFGANFEEQIEAIYDAKPAIFSFVYGIPSSDVLENCRRLGIKTIGAATTVDEAIALENGGVDAIVATGFEAGGHRVSFLRSAEDSLTGTFSLIPQVVDNVKIPIIAAGGIADARGIKAALALGADAVQMGTAFLATTQSNASQDHKDKLFTLDAKYTTLTKVFTGRLSRGIRNRLTEELKHHEDLFAPYPLQSKFMGLLKAYPSSTDSNSDYKSYWAGQSALLLKHRDAKILMETLVNEMNKM
ncbi:nitronate monooxygenase [Flavobacterium sp.]|uniref:NAD(P)H-dependent flavin oxidoreductase n=1 Tax=Flavobacterium sp. TaxID=239 RepID=UPI00286DF846|nr:nitronate monooxygenase [Flavobacterium sp.]